VKLARSFLNTCLTNVSATIGSFLTVPLVKLHYLKLLERLKKPTAVNTFELFARNSIDRKTLVLVLSTEIFFTYAPLREGYLLVKYDWVTVYCCEYYPTCAYISPGVNVGVLFVVTGGIVEFVSFRKTAYLIQIVAFNMYPDWHYIQIGPALFVRQPRILV